MFDLNYIDRSIFGRSEQFVAGTDEVGRGPLAGPVVSCTLAIKIEKNHRIDDVKNILTDLLELGVCDSKKITAKRRAKILTSMGIITSKLKVGKVYRYSLNGYQLIYSICEISPKEIDRINILQASLLAMKKSFLSIYKDKKDLPVTLLVDGNKKIDFGALDIEQESIVGGDSKSLIIGLASIIAKEYRDHLMAKYDQEYPGYGLKKHSGYPTKFHREAIAQLGITAIHRKSFAGVREYV